MTYRKDPWQSFEEQLEWYASRLRQIKYDGALCEPPAAFRLEWHFLSLPENGICPDQIMSVLSSESVGPPHGFDVLRPAPLPELPPLPSRPADVHVKARPASPLARLFGAGRSREVDATAERHRLILQKANELESKRETLQQELNRQFGLELEKLQALRQRCLKNDIGSIRVLMERTHTWHRLPKVLARPLQFDLDREARIALCTIEIPDFSGLSIVRKRGDSGKGKWLPVSVADRRRLNETILDMLCLRAVYLAAKSDAGNWFHTVAVNAKQHWHDPATGAAREGIIASLQASKAEILELQFDRIDAKACFRHLKGISTPGGDHSTDLCHEHGR